jgi:phosphoribosylanthranilate isomerase
MTSAADIALAVAAGADAVGIIVSASDRRVDARDVPALLAAVPPFVTAVLVSANAPNVVLASGGGPDDDRAGAPGKRVDLASARDVDFARYASTGIVLQFSGDETPDACERVAAGRAYVKAFHVRAEDGRATFDRATLAAYPHAMPLFDSRSGAAFGGTGIAFDWERIAGFARERPIVVSGGLTPQNVGACVAAVRPYAVDVRGGIETDGVKDAMKMRDFVAAVRAADDRTVSVPAMPNVR